MTFSKGQGSGRGNGRLSSAIGKPAPVQKARKPMVRKEYRCSRCDARTLAGGLCSGCALSEAGERPAPALKRASHGKARPGGSGAWRRRCLERNIETYGVATCEATGQHLTIDWQCHHVIEASVLNAMGLAGSKTILWNIDNGMCLNPGPHMAHHNWSPRITADALRAYHWDFAVLLDNTHGTEWASQRLARDYPLAA